jgi:fido (protein-threonine AMPylation protein)
MGAYDTICSTSTRRVPVPTPSALTKDQVIALFRDSVGLWLRLRDLLPKVTVSRTTLHRRLSEAVTAGELEVRGKGAGQEYRAPGNVGTANIVLPMVQLHATGTTGPRWSQQSRALRAYVQQPRALRAPVSYQEGLVDDYVPNQTFWLPASLRAKLATVGRSSGERPAGTYARDILGQLLIDLAWSSSRLEGNRYSRLETKDLIETAQSASGKTQQETVMVLNHKRAIEFLVDIASHDDPYDRVIANMHALLMDGLMKDENALGAIRKRLVAIEESAYTPWQAPAQLERMYKILCAKAQDIEDPLESSFFLLTQLPYLQPFEDGNKRTARVACNLPLAKSNFAPLAFLDVDDADYFLALMAIYEKADVTVAVDLFEWAYLRSVQGFAAVKQAMGQPDAFRTRLRPELSRAVQQVVVQNMAADAAVATLNLPAQDSEDLARLVEHELHAINANNYARYGLAFSQFDAWYKARNGGNSHSR